MKTVRASSSDEVVLVWLQAELKSKRFQNDLRKSLDKHDLDAQIITEPDLSNRPENDSRLMILKDYRDWFEDDVDAYRWGEKVGAPWIQPLGVCISVRSKAENSSEST